MGEVVSRVALILVGAFAFGTAQASKPSQTVPAPDVRPGDAWILVGSTETHVGNHNGFRQNRHRLTVTNIEGDRLQLSVNEVGSPMPPRVILRGRDMANYVSVAGVDTLSAQPMNFPMFVGKHWKVAYETTSPSDRKYAWTRFEREYSVTDFAPVTVAGGTFQAFRIEMSGRWQARFAPGVDTVAHVQSDAGGSNVAIEQERATAGSATGGRLYSEIWYAPTAKHWIKLTEETYSSTGVMSEKTETELERFEPTTSAGAATISSR